MIGSKDIIYQNNRITILNPFCKKGVVIGARMYKNNNFFQFNVPYYVRGIDYSTPMTEVISSYGWFWSIKKKRVYIRVDPKKTYIDESNILLIDYMNEKAGMSLFQQFVKNDSKQYHISCNIKSLSSEDTVKVS